MSGHLEWEVIDVRHRLYKGRGDSPEAALLDLRESFVLGIDSAKDALDREQKRLDKIESILGALPAVRSVGDPDA